MSKVFQPATLAGAISIALVSTISFANSEKNVIQLEPIVVTATRTALLLSHVAAQISVIDQHTVSQSSIQSLPNLLKEEAALNVVQTGGYSQQSSIFLRGTNSNHTLFLRDGVRLNPATSGIPSTQFLDTTDIKQIEVLKGAASVLYGSDAIGGVIQMISQTPEKNSAFISTEAGEDHTYKAIVGADLAENGVYAQVRGQRLETDGTKVVDFKQKNLGNAGFDQKGFSAKVGTEQQDYALSLDYAQNQGTGEYVNCNVFNPDYSCDGFALIGQDFSNELINFNSRLNITSDWAVKLRLSQFKDDLDQNSSPDFTHSTSQEADFNSIWQLNPHNNILLGISQQQQKGDVLSFGSKYSDKARSTGYYLQHQYQQDGFNTQVGVRVEDHNKYGTHTVGQAAIRYQVLPLTSVYANVGSAFKSPNLNQFYSSTSANKHLKPEESVSYELGVDQKLNYGLSAGLSLYQIEVKNLIDYDAAFKLQNMKKAQMTGSESYITWQNDDFYAKASYNYVKSKSKETDTDLMRRPRQSFTLDMGLRNDMYGLGVAINSKSHAEDYQQTVAGYLTADLHGYYHLNPNIKLFANIENVGDTEYKAASYQAGTYYINGGRLASAGVTLRY